MCVSELEVGGLKTGAWRGWLTLATFDPPHAAPDTLEHPEDRENSNEEGRGAARRGSARRFGGHAPS